MANAQIKYQHIFWDWNGTLIDDVELCVECINKSLAKHGLKPLSREKYSEVFRFPVIEYYKDVGFDFNKTDWNEVATEYVDNYAEGSKNIKLFPDVKEVLAVIKSKGIKQYILSASEKTVLLDSLQNYGIQQYFTDICALDNHYAESKIELGKRFVENNGISGSKLMIGDTEHDYETAKAIGADCVLFLGGHYSERRLKNLGVPVINSLNELYPYLIETTKERPAQKKYDVHNADSDEKRSYDLIESTPNDFKTRYKDFYDDLKNTNKTEDW